MPGLRETLAGLCRRPFGIVHLAWAILILSGCVALVLMGGGHPPPMIFVPPLLVAGVLGHGLLLLVAWLLGRGRARAAAGQTGTPRWPAELILLAITLGVLAICSIAITIGEIPKVRQAPLVWLLFAAVAVLHGAAFVTLLLRIGAARYLIAAIATGWGLALLLQMREARGPGELTLGILLVAGLAGIAAYVMRSLRIRSVLR
jgi:hypothetical protein